ncbi:MAG: DNA adenine methylase, partial [Chloroflexota bacterium]
MTNIQPLFIQPPLRGFDQVLPHPNVKPLTTQFLKWIGNKQRFAPTIISYFPSKYGTYYEPFLGSGAVLGTLAPSSSVAFTTLFILPDLMGGIMFTTFFFMPNSIAFLALTSSKYECLS